MERIIKQVEFAVPAQPKVTRVAAYARVSNGKDAMLHSLSAQVSQYSKLIQGHRGWQYCGVYSDEAFTGTKANRDGFQKLLAECRAGNIDMIITKSISRFARNTVTLLETVRELRLLGIDVFFEEQNIHTISAEGELIMTILASYAQAESYSASENMKWKIRQAFERGELIGLRCLYGYDITKEGIQVNPDEAEIVREIFRRIIAGDSMNAIAKDLNEREIPTALGGKWYSHRIHDIVANEKYTGNALLQKKYRNNHLEKKLIRNNGELPQYYAEGTHDAIIDNETYETAQKVLQQNQEVYSQRAKPQKNPFSQKIVCAHCGRSYIRLTINGKVYWNCSTLKNHGKGSCTAKRIPESLMYSLSTEVLGLLEFDADAFHNKITAVRAEENHTLTFCFSDGKEIVKPWEIPSRAYSWTPEMKEAAAAKTRKRRRRQNEQN